LTWFVTAAFVMRLLRRRALLGVTAAKVRAILTISTSAMAATSAMHAVSILAAVALVMAVLRRILLRLAAASDERWQPAVLSSLMTTLAGLLLIWLLLMLWTIMHLLIAWRERLSVARQVRLLLGLARSVARLVHERLGVVIVVVKSLVSALLARRALLLLLVVVRILLTELLLSGGDETKIVLGVLIIVFGCNGIPRALRVASELDIFFRDVRSGAANFDVGTI